MQKIGRPKQARCKRGHILRKGTYFELVRSKPHKNGKCYPQRQCKRCCRIRTDESMDRRMRRVGEVINLAAEAS